jgi:hypothetical protein
MLLEDTGLTGLPDGIGFGKPRKVYGILLEGSRD